MLFVLCIHFIVMFLLSTICTLSPLANYESLDKELNSLKKQFETDVMDKWLERIFKSHQHI